MPVCLCVCVCVCVLRECREENVGGDINACVCVSIYLGILEG